MEPTASDPLDGILSATGIMSTNYPPVEYVVPGVIPEGLTLLVAAPKIGKSWMVLGIAVAASTGGTAFGSIPVVQRPVLYLALEDGARRLKSRMTKIHAQPAHGLSFITDLNGFTPGQVIGTYLERHAGQKPMVILDTLGKVRGISNGNDAYGRDYTQMSALKDLVDAHPGSSLIVVHHTNKGGQGDFLDSVSGTQGLAGAADTIAVIKRDRGAGGATINVTSRDALEGEYAITLTDGIWTLDGTSLTEAAQALEDRAHKEGTGDRMQEVIDVVLRYPDGVRAKDIAELTRLDRAAVDLCLKRAYDAGRIERPKRGIYTPARSERSERSEDPDAANLSHLSLLSPTEEGTAA